MMSPETVKTFDLRFYESLDSTNEEAKRLLTAGQVHRPTLIHAATQTAGKGTRGRTWLSPPNAGLYFSIVHPTNPHAEARHGLTPFWTLAAGVACARSLQSLTGLCIRLKPINDLYVDRCKLGGILTESLISENYCKAIITGIGINIRNHAALTDADASLSNPPTTLQACIPPHLFDQWHPSALQQELLWTIAEEVDSIYQQMQQEGPVPIQAAYLQFKISEAFLSQSQFENA